MYLFLGDDLSEDFFIKLTKGEEPLNRLSLVLENERRWCLLTQREHPYLHQIAQQTTIIHNIN